MTSEEAGKVEGGDCYKGMKNAELLSSKELSPPPPHPPTTLPRPIPPLRGSSLLKKDNMHSMPLSELCMGCKGVHFH